MAADGLELWWLGQSGFRLQPADGGPTLFVDPFLGPHQERVWPAPLTPEELGRQADAVLCTHEHLDHFDQPALCLAAAAPSLPRERIVGAQPDEPLDLAGARIAPMPARHGVHVHILALLIFGRGARLACQPGASYRQETSRARLPSLKPRGAP